MAEIAIRVHGDQLINPWPASTVPAGVGRGQKREGARMNASGMRLLCLCPVCGKLGDEQTMVKVGPMKSQAHDRCVFAQLGDGILNLPSEERAKFTLAVVGPDLMRRLIQNT
jgi:hypothetical protein